jgi:hypothetical protein
MSLASYLAAPPRGMHGAWATTPRRPTNCITASAGVEGVPRFLRLGPY